MFMRRREPGANPAGRYRNRLPSLATALGIGLAVLATAATAGAVPPTNPRILTPLPPFIDGPVRIELAEAAFDPAVPAQNRWYAIRVRDITGGGLGVEEVVPMADRVAESYLPEVVLPPEGRRFILAGAAFQTAGPDCEHADVLNVLVNEMLCPREYGVGGPAINELPIVTVDRTPPVVASASINAGAVFTNDLRATITVDGASDPIVVPGLDSAGVATVESSATGTFTCASILTGGPQCPVRLSDAGVPGQLADGPDGLRTMYVRVRDGARGTPPLGCIFCVAAPTGNISAVVTDTIILDRTAPIVRLTQSSASVRAGQPVTFDASTSSDGANGPLDSGVPLDGVTWTVGDGSSAAGGAVTHRYMRPGTINGAVNVRDRAGNVATQPFTVQVGNPIVGRLTKTGAYRVNRRNRVRITTTAPTTFTAVLRRAGRIQRSFRVTAGPGTVNLNFKPKRTGSHVLRVTGGGVTRTIRLNVVR